MCNTYHWVLSEELYISRTFGSKNQGANFCILWEYKAFFSAVHNKVWCNSVLHFHWKIILHKSKHKLQERGCIYADIFQAQDRVHYSTFVNKTECGGFFDSLNDS